MKKLVIIVLAALMLLTLAQAEVDLSGMDYSALVELREQVNAAIAACEPDAPHIPTAVKASPDKYTWYIQDYVGRNAAGFGYTSLGGDRMEEYGHGHAQFCFITEDGSYLDFSDQEILSRYVVVGQSPAPNTEMKLTFETNSDGEEYDYLVDHQSVEVIDLRVCRIGEDAVSSAELTENQPSPDKYTWYMRDYVGKNVYSFGYTSLGGDRMDEYGHGHIKFAFVADDGAYIDPEDEEILKQYVVTGQDIAPNTEIKMTYQTDSKGNEYSNLVDTQTYKGITLYVKKIGE